MPLSSNILTWGWFWLNRSEDHSLKSYLRFYFPLYFIALLNGVQVGGFQINSGEELISFFLFPQSLILKLNDINFSWKDITSDPLLMASNCDSVSLQNKCLLPLWGYNSNYVFCSQPLIPCKRGRKKLRNVNCSQFTPSAICSTSIHTWSTET